MNRNFDSVGRAMVYLLSSAIVGGMLGMTSIYGFQVDMKEKDFTPTGRGSQRTIVVTNKKAETIAVELFAQKRGIDENGTETSDKAEDDFLIYPAQLILEPGEEEIVTVIWQGDPDPIKELAYRVVASEVSIDTGLGDENKQKVAKFNFLSRYVKSIYVVPRNAKSKVKLASPKRTKKDGKEQMEVVFENQGTKHVVLRNLIFKLIPVDNAGNPKSNAEVALFPDSDPPRSFGAVNILSGNKRRFVVELPKGFPRGPARVVYQTFDVWDPSKIN